jgi:multimeric flavodoxin WrbA
MRFGQLEYLVWSPKNKEDKDMKVVGVISSSNLNGNTAALVRQALKGAEEEGASVTEMYLPKYRIEFCTGCAKCMAEGSCHIPDEFESLKRVIYDADGIILSSPTYGGSPNAMIKRFIERLGMYERFTSSLGGKHVIGISTCSSMGAKGVARNLVLLVSNGIFKRGYISGILGVGQHGKIITENVKVLRKAHELGRKMARDIKNGKTYPLQNSIGRLINQIFVKPMFRSALIKQKEGMLKAVFTNLHQRGLI